jgi:Holliday junction resolvasome RuvABC endonuclease subunit
VRYVVGIDLSLTSTGVAACDPDTGAMYAVAVRSTGHANDPLTVKAARASAMAADIVAAVDACHPFLVVIESAYFNTGATDNSAHRRAGLWWMVVCELSGRYPVAEVTPAGLKKFVTGSGSASKEAREMAVASRFGADVLGERVGSADDRADAAGLAAMGGYAAGYDTFDRTAARNAAVQAVQWPEVPDAPGPAAQQVPADSFRDNRERAEVP